jgi:hypothetical protein
MQYSKEQAMDNKTLHIIERLSNMNPAKARE